MRPIDLQGIVTKTQDVERLQRIQQQHPLLSQEQFSERLRKEAEENLRRVKSAEESHLAGISDKKEERQKRHHANDQERPEGIQETENDASKSEADTRLKGRHIDVKA